MKVLFINDSTSSPNWGDRAAAVSLMAMTSSRGGQIVHSISERGLIDASLGERRASGVRAPKGRAWRVAAAFVPPAPEKIWLRVTERRGGSRESRLIPRRWADFERAADLVLAKKDLWPALRSMLPSVDLAVIHGDGAMVNNGPHPRAILFLTYLIKTRFDKPVIIVNHTADFNHPDLRETAHHVYPLFDDVVFRDPISLDRCKMFCGGRFAPDTGFWFKPLHHDLWAQVARRPTFFDVWPDSAVFDPAEPYVCLGGSSILGPLNERASAIPRYAELVRQIQAVYRGQIVLTASDPVDEEIFRPLASRLGLPLVGLTTPIQQAVDILGNSDAYIGGRWHPSIFALRGGAPILPLSSKTFKMQALSEMAGLSVPVFDAMHPERDGHAIARQLRSFLERGSELRDQLRSWAEGMAEGSWDNVAHLEKADRSEDALAITIRP